MEILSAILEKSARSVRPNHLSNERRERCDSILKCWFFGYHDVVVRTIRNEGLGLKAARTNV